MTPCKFSLDRRSLHISYLIAIGIAVFHGLHLRRLRPYFDIYVLWIALLLLAVNVIFGDLIVDAGGNPVGLGILAFVLLFAGRCFLGPEPKDSRDSYSW